MPSAPPRQNSRRENPFASFYDSRRRLRVADAEAEPSDSSSSITRAYIVPRALLALSRGDVAMRTVERSCRRWRLELPE